MGFRHIFLFIIISILTFCGCSRKSFGMIDSTEIHIHRFDSALFQWIDSDNPIILSEIKNKYPMMLEMLGKALFKEDTPDTTSFFDYLINYYSEPTLNSLYKDAIALYSAGSQELVQATNELSYGFQQMKKQFPLMQIPAVYMHVSGLQQNIIVADSLMSISIDKYMGVSYPLYEDFFYDFQRKCMVPERIAKDGLSAWLKSEYPFNGKDNVLLDRMIYEGKIMYILTQTGNDYSFQNISSLTEEEIKWCIEHESSLWTAMIERKHLYTPDFTTTSKYFQHTPSQFIAEQAPGNLGTYIGYKIVERYMKQTKSTCEELMNNYDAQDILKKSKYKP